MRSWGIRFGRNTFHSLILVALVLVAWTVGGDVILPSVPFPPYHVFRAEVDRPDRAMVLGGMRLKLLDDTVLAGRDAWVMLGDVDPDDTLLGFSTDGRGGTDRIPGTVVIGGGRYADPDGWHGGAYLAIQGKYWCVGDRPPWANDQGDCDLNFRLRSIPTSLNQTGCLSLSVDSAWPVPQIRELWRFCDDGPVLIAEDRALPVRIGVPDSGGLGQRVLVVPN